MLEYAPDAYVPRIGRSVRRVTIAPGLFDTGPAPTEEEVNAPPPSTFIPLTRNVLPMDHLGPKTQISDGPGTRDVGREGTCGTSPRTGLTTRNRARVPGSLRRRLLLRFPPPKSFRQSRNRRKESL